MHPDFWHERWQQNQIGFHQDEVHPMLRDHWPALASATGSRVFAPLCGKSLDLWWLRQQGHGVVGVELSPLAVAAFFDEARVTPARSTSGPLESLQASDITIYCGDFFDLQPEHVAGCRIVYDRAALIALPAEMRAAYVAHLHRLFPAGADMLLVTLDYPQQEMNGPPFSVGDAEVHALFGDARLLENTDVLAQNERFRQRGVTRMDEKAFLIEINNG